MAARTALAKLHPASALAEAFLALPRRAWAPGNQYLSAFPGVRTSHSWFSPFKGPGRTHKGLGLRAGFSNIRVQPHQRGALWPFEGNQPPTSSSSRTSAERQATVRL